MSERIMDIEAREEQQTPYDASDRKQVNAARKKAARKNSKRLEVIKALMQHKDGREWIYELLERGHIYVTSFTPGDPYRSAFNEGERNYANQILIDVTLAAPDEYLMMMRESRERG